MATTQRGIYYNTDYSAAADVLEDERLMAESIDDAIENSEENAEELYVKKIAGKGLSTNDFTDAYKEKVDGDYTKPSGGIPKTDLANDVQTSLGKADTALQEHQDISGKEDKSITGTSTNTYDSTKTYNIGDIVVQSGKIYKAKEDNITGTFDSTKWDEISLFEYQKIQDKKLEDNYKVITKLNEELEEERANDLTATLEIATSYHLTDSAKARFRRFGPEGHSEQETTEGYQLIDAPTKFDFTATTTGESIDIPRYNLIVGTMFYKFNEISGLGTINPKLWIMAGNSVLKNVFTNNTFTLTAEELAQVTAVKIYLQGTTSGTTYSIKANPMVNSGDTAKTYEPYTGGRPSPNPSYEQSINSAGDNVQLFDKNTVITQDGYLHSTEKVLYYVANRKYFYISCEPNEDYTISKKAGQWFRVGTFSSVPEVGSTAINVVSNDTGDKITINSGVGANYLLVNYIHTERDTVTEQEILDSIKIEKGTVASPWSPYGMGSINEKIVNKNWYDKSTISWFKNNSSDFLNTGDNNTTRIRTNSFMIKGGKTYIISGFPDGTVLNNIRTYDKNKTYLGTATKTDNTFELNSDVAYIHILCQGSNFDSTTNTLMKNADIQIELGSTATDYVEHQEQTYTIPTQQPMRSIGTVRDDFIKQEGVWYERHKIKRLVFDGTETGWSVNNNVFYRTISDKKIAKTQMYSNYFIYKSVIWQNLSNYEFSDDNTTATIFIKDEDYSSIDNFKTWLSTQYANATPLCIDYILATPTDLPCTQAQIDILENLPRTYKNETNVISLDEIEAYIDFEYVQDTKTYIDNQITNLSNAIVALGGVV